MQTNPNALLEELLAADAQGERAISTLKPGDQFLYRSTWWLVDQMQFQHRGYVRVDCSAADVDEATMSETFLFGSFISFPALITDDHFAAENPTEETW